MDAKVLAPKILSENRKYDFETSRVEDFGAVFRVSESGSPKLGRESGRGVKHNFFFSKKTQTYF